jgi:uncharacterized membrane protein YfcA
MSLLIASFTIIAVAAAAQAVTGFGFALVAVPLLTLASDAHTAVVAVCLAGLVPSLVSAALDRGHVHWRPAWILSGLSMIGMPVGLLVRRVLPDRGLTVVVAVSVLVCVLIVWRGIKLPETAGTVGAVGAIAGVLGTATGTNGPPLVAAFQAMGMGPRAFRGTLAAIFAVTGVAGALAYLLAGEVTSQATMMAAAGTPAAVLGWLAGDRLFGRIDPAGFRRIVLGFLVVTAATVLVRAGVG